MKRFTILTMLVALLSMTAFAQKGTKSRSLGALPKSPNTTLLKGIDRHSLPTGLNARRAATAELVTPPTEAAVDTFYTTSGKFYIASDNGNVDATNDMDTIFVVFNGSDIYIQGLAYWFKEGWIKGTIANGTATFPAGQAVGEDKYGVEYLVGSSDTETVADITFAYDSTEGTLTATISYIIESDSADEVAAYCYWVNPVFSKVAPEAPEVVTAPEGLVAEEYAISYTKYDEEEASGYVNIGFDGNDVYLQGICSRLPEAWIKGTLDGTTITFAANQFLGSYNSRYDIFLQEEDVVFTYDATANTLTLDGTVYTYTGNQYADYYVNPVITKIVELAGIPATPSILQIGDEGYGDEVFFSIPVIDTEGNPMTSSKLAFRFYVDVNHDISQLTFQAEDYDYLDEDMSEIPYGFTEDYDFYIDQIFLNMEHSNWNRMGIQSIYSGGGEVNSSEISWFTIKDFNITTFDFNAMTDEPCSATGVTDGDITENRVLTAGDVTLTISPKTEGATTANRFWKTNNGPQLRVYSGTLTFQVPANKVITKMVFNNGRWHSENTVDTGSLDDNVWTGEANKVVVTIGGNTQLNNIEVTVDDFIPSPVEAPADLETEIYIFNALSMEHSDEETMPTAEPYTAQIEVGYYGDDLYIQGLATDCPELWVKATKNDAGQYVIPANQYMGALELFGGMFTFDYFFTAVDEEDNLTDVVLNLDADTKTLSTNQLLALNGAIDKLDYYMLFTNVFIEKFVEVAATPADPKLSSINFGANYPNIKCSIPTIGTNGEPLNANKLFYTVWIEKDGKQQPYVFTAEAYSEDFDEDTTEVPYTFDGYDFYAGGEIVYFEEEAEELSSWSRVGIQSIYYGAGECNKSNVVWMINDSFDDPTGIATINADSSKTVIYNLAGQRISAPRKGMNIINGHKVLVK